MLAWQSSFRNFEWESEFPDPTISIRELQKLLVLV